MFGNHRFASLRLVLPATGVVLGGLACSDSTNSAAGRLSFSVSTRQSPVTAVAVAGSSLSLSAAVVQSGDSTVLITGGDTIILRDVELVLRKVELKQVETSACDSVAAHDDCEEFESGTQLVSLPLGTTQTAAVVSINAPSGQYDELKFEIHKVEMPEDSAFLAANPTWAGVSIKASGTFSHAGSRSDFSFVTDLDAAQESAISPPLTVTTGVPANVTLRLDVSQWFMVSGALVDPTSANVGGPNESAVKNNIVNSIHGMKDDNHDGLDDSTEEGSGSGM